MRLIFLAVLALSACSGSRAPDAGDERAFEETHSTLPRAALPLGVGALSEQWEQCVLARGMVLTRILRGEADQAAQPLPCTVQDAFTLMGGGSGRATLTLESGPRPNGPWAVHILEVDGAHFPGRMQLALGQDAIIGKESPLTLATRTGAVATVNAGFFVVGAGIDGVNADGVAGDPAGIGVLDGQLVSEAIRGRTALAWRDGRPERAFFPQVATNLQAVAPSEDIVLPVDGINRIPGRIRNCGGSGDSPTDAPRHDQTCTDADELIWFEPIWGADTPAGDGWELVIDANDTVIAHRPQGGPIPEGGAVLTATGDRVEPLLGIAIGKVLRLRTVWTDERETTAQPAAIDRLLSMTNGGPILVRNGAILNRDAEEGFVEPLGGDPGENPLDSLAQRATLTAFRETGQPRTLAGVTADDRLLLIVVDGRQPDWSVGLSFDDARDLLLHLGVVEGMNLDGGGSSSLSANGITVNRPSDGQPRAVSDSIAFRLNPARP